MEKFQEIFQMVLAIGGSIVVLASAVVAFTPSKDDDNWFAEILNKPIIGAALKYFLAHSLIEKKAGGTIELSNKPK